MDGERGRGGGEGAGGYDHFVAISCGIFVNEQKKSCESFKLL